MKTMMDRNSQVFKRDLRILFPIEPEKGIWLQWLGLMLLSSILKRAGFEVEVVKADMQELRQKLKDGRPTLLGYTVPTYLAKFYIEFNKQVKKEFDVFTIFGGPHPTFFPEMIESEGVDAICVGEGENALLELAEKLDEGKSIYNINNLWIKENGEIRKNSLGPLVHNLDEIPFADRSLFYPYQPKSRLSPTGLMASRGCPYRCTYCFNKAFRKLYADNKKSHYRRRSVANFIEELQELKKRYPATYFVFWDDIFTMSKSWLEEFVGEYRAKIGIPFNCNVRANLVTKDIARLLKEGGCNLASLGLEAANDHLRDEVLKRNMNKKQITDAIEFLKKEGIKVHTFNLIGIPKGTVDNDLETLELNIRTKVDYPMCFILHPYHRTELYDIALREGLIQKEFQELNGVGNPYGYHPPLKRDAKEREEIENLHKLFSFLVKIKASPSLAKRFIKLPLGKLYSLIYRIDFNYARYVRQPPAKLDRLMKALKQGNSPPDQQVGESESQLIGN